MMVLLTQVSFAYDKSFLSSDEFVLFDGVWKWQIYAATDDAYIDTDMYSNGRRYLSGEQIQKLPNKSNQLFYGVKAVTVPYDGEVMINTLNSVTGDNLDKVRLKILKNNDVVLPLKGEWCRADEINRAENLKISAKGGDVIRFITAPANEKPVIDFEIKWNPRVILRTEGKYISELDFVKDDDCSKVTFKLINPTEEEVDISPIIAVYDGEVLADAYFLDSQKIASYTQKECDFTFYTTQYTEVKMFLISDITKVIPKDNPIELYRAHR